MGLGMGREKWVSSEHVSFTFKNLTWGGGYEKCRWEEEGMSCSFYK